jgi:hypothetical protein
MPIYPLVYLYLLTSVSLDTKYIAGAALNTLVIILDQLHASKFDKGGL